VATIAAAFPDLVELDLSSNTNLTGAAMKSIASLAKLERLTLVQTRFNDLNTRRLAKLGELKALDLRGNMEAGDMTLGVVGGLPKPHGRSSTAARSSPTTGLAELAASPGARLAARPRLRNHECVGAAPREAMKNLTSLEIFRCQGIRHRGRAGPRPARQARPADAPRPARGRRRRPGRTGRSCRP
jgi:hypothetical protein